MPSLTCSLLSVSQLIDDSDYIATFSKYGCVLQDRTSRMLIGAKCQDGLYYFKGKSRVKALKVDKVGLLDLWHKRLGHPSLKITKLVPVIDSTQSSSVLNKCCDVCQ